MKKIILLLPIIIISIIALKASKISNFIYYKYVSEKIEKNGKIYLEELKKTKKKIYEIVEDLEGYSIPSWKKMQDISKKIDSKAFVLVKDPDGYPLRWAGDVKDFYFENGFRAVFTTEGPFFVLCKDTPYGKTIVSFPVPHFEKSKYLKNINFFPSKYFFPLPDTLKPPTYSFLYKEKGPPIIGITFEAISFTEFKDLFYKVIKTIAGIYLIFILFFFKINFLIKIIFLRLFLSFISFELFPILNLLIKNELFYYPLPFLKNGFEMAITFALLLILILKLEIKFNFKISIILFLITSFFYLFLISEMIKCSNLLDYSLILKIDIFLLSSAFIIFWLRNFEFKYLKYFLLFFIPFLYFFPSIYSFLFLILGTLGILTIKEKKFSFFLLLGLWALIPPYIFQREAITKHLKNSYSFLKLNQTTFDIIKVKNSFLDILKKWDWEKEFPLIYLIEDKKGLIDLIEKKLSLKEMAIDFKLDLYEKDELVGTAQNRNFPSCSIISKEGFYQEDESVYHLSYPLYHRGSYWGWLVLHLYFYPPLMSKKETLPVGLGIYGKDKVLQNSNAIFIPEKLESKEIKQGVYQIYQEGENYYLFLIPPWEFSFPYFIFGFLVILGAISSISFTFEFKSIYFLILFPFLLILFLIIFLGFLFTSNQRKSIQNFQALWGGAIQKNVINYIKEFNSTFYYKNGMLSGGEIIEEKFYFCPSFIMSKLPLKNPEIFEIEGDYYLFIEDKEKNLMGFKQPNLLGMEKPVQWLAEKTWGSIMFFYGIFLIILIYLLGRILNPIKNLSMVAKEIEKGKEFYEIKPIFGKEVENLSLALKSSFMKLQDEEKTLKLILNNLPVGVALFEGGREIISNKLIPLRMEEILNLKDEGTFELDDKIYQYKKLKLTENKWIFFMNDITVEIEKEKLVLVSNLARIVAHEIKNPLTPIKLSIEYLKEIFSKKKDDFFQDFPKISDEMLDSLKDLESISSEFSDFTRLPSLKKEKINLNSFFSNWLKPFISNNKIKLTPPKEEIFCNLDPRLFKRAIINLLNNAWQSKDPPPMIYLNLSKGEMVKIEIIDEGPGVPEGFLEKLFEPYFTTKTSGTGIGLFISKKIIEEHKGKISAENTKDKGLKVTIFLPL